MPYWGTFMALDLVWVGWKPRQGHYLTCIEDSSGFVRKEPSGPRESSQGSYDCLGKRQRKRREQWRLTQQTVLRSVCISAVT